MKTTFHLYHGLNETDINKKLYDKPTTHQGLRFTKFFGRWNKDDRLKLLDEVATEDGPFRTEPLLDWLKPTVGPQKRDQATNELLQIGDANELTVACQRIEAMANKVIHSRFDTDAYSSGAMFQYSLVSRLMTGMGLPHPTENGFLFHPTLAVPYIRGTALKQVARAWAESEEGIAQTELDRVFGRANSSTETGNAGCIAFLDALPTRAVELTGEQITNHYQPYYENVDPLDRQVQRDDMHQPGDWHEPNPVCVLAVDASLDKKLPFLFTILPMDDASLDDVRNVAGWLRSGLEIEGVGARSSVGYGRLEHDLEEERKLNERLAKEESAKREANEQALIGAMTPERRAVYQAKEVFDSGKWKTDDKTLKAFNNQLADLRRDAIKWASLADRIDAADLLENWYEATGWGSKKSERRALIKTLRQPDG